MNAPFFDDWWNPILVKEVRQALRGKYFKICFWIVLLAVVVAMAGMMVGFLHDDEITRSEGRNFFVGIFACLAIAVLAFVPFSAFNAVGAEWEENTFDLLIISNLRPRQIVVGKLLGAGVQTLLFYSTFTPFLVFSSLLRGVDMVNVWIVLAGAFLYSMVLTLIAIALSTMSRVRFARIVLMFVLGGALIFATVGGIGAGTYMIQEPGVIRQPLFWMRAGMVALAAAIAATYCFAIASNLLAHPEENRSTGVRLITTGALLLSLWWLHSMTTMVLDREALSAVSITLIVFLMIPGTFFATEPEQLGRRVEPRVPKNPLLAALSIPFLPGGGRGLLLYSAHLCLVTWFGLWMHHVLARSSGQPLLDEGAAGILAAALYAFLYVALPSAVLAPFTDRAVLRAAARAVVPFMIATFAFVPAVVGVFLGNHALENMDHPGNPFFLINEVRNGDLGKQPAVWMLVAALAVLALVLNVYRVVVGVRQVFDASRARARRASSRGEESLPPPAPGSAPDALAGS